jgi:hypothetical protein
MVTCTPCLSFCLASFQFAAGIKSELTVRSLENGTAAEDAYTYLPVRDSELAKGEGSIVG